MTDNTTALLLCVYTLICIFTLAPGRLNDGVSLSHLIPSPAEF